MAFFDGVIESAQQFLGFGVCSLCAGLCGELHGVRAGIHVNGVISERAAFLCDIMHIKADVFCIVIDGRHIASDFLKGAGQCLCERGEICGALLGGACSFEHFARHGIDAPGAFLYRVQDALDRDHDIAGDEL